MGIRTEQTWTGIGLKVGGIAIVGLETFEGVACRLDSWQNSWHAINVTNLRLGIGLGGSAGVSVFFGFNVGTLWEVNGMTLTDWGINIALPEAKLGIGALSKELVFMKDLAGVGKEMMKAKIIGKVTPETIQKLRDLASVLFNSLTEGKDGATSTKPTLVVIDVPGLGWGAELSAFLSGGEFTVDKALSSSDLEKK